MSKNSKKVTIITSPTPLDVVEPLEDKSIQATKAQPVVQNVEPQVIAKPKRALTDAQKAVLEEGRKKGREKINAKNELIKQEKIAMKNKVDDLERQLKEQKDKEFETKIVQKAVSIKKKQIKRDAVLDQISDDDTNIEEIKEIKKRAPQKKTPAPAPVQESQPKGPKIIFV